MEVEIAFNRWLEANSAVSVQTSLLAVSGGLDSMVLIHLCHSSNLKVEVAHINYGLRGRESDLDEELVVQTCQGFGIKFHVSRWKDETETGSVQMRCREFRYKEFSRLMDQQGFSNTLVGHHADDSVETVLINLFRGTGFRGLTGITENRSQILRPLLQTNRAEILAYAKKHGVKYRDDHTNFESDYDRNFIRNEVLPVMATRFENASQGIQKTAANMSQAAEFIEQQVLDLLKPQSSESGLGTIRIDLENPRLGKHRHFILCEYLRQFGFNHAQVSDMQKAAHSGATFSSQTHVVTHDRGELIIQPFSSLHTVATQRVDLKTPPSGFSFSTIQKTKNWSPDQAANVAEIDLQKIEGANLHLRSWKQGDRFKPLGMRGWKKLSDLFIDLKISVTEKPRTPILTADGEIVWVVELQIDDRFKVTPSTDSILRIEYHRSA